LKNTLSFFLFLPIVLLLTALSAEENLSVSYILVDFEQGSVIDRKDNAGFLEQPFPPGSLIKLFSTYAYLRDGGDSYKVLLCPETSIGSSIPPGCWYRPGHGYMDLIGAIANSCDTYFSKFFTLKRFTLLVNVLNQYQLITGSDFETLLALSSAQKRETWIGIGKHLRIRPVDLFFAIYSIVGNGSIYERSDSYLIFERKMKTGSNFVRVIREGMREGSLTGTTKTVQEIIGMKKVFCKTGTATYFFIEEDYRKTHGYFIGFCPYPEPQWGILVFLLNGDGKAAAKIGATILKDLLKQEENGY